MKIIITVRSVVVDGGFSIRLAVLVVMEAMVKVECDIC